MKRRISETTGLQWFAIKPMCLAFFAAGAVACDHRPPSSSSAVPAAATGTLGGAPDKHAGVVPISPAASDSNPSSSPRAVQMVPAPEATPEPGEPTRLANIEGLQLRFYANGHIVLSGADRWSKALSTTYESAEYLLNSLPALERSLDSRQITALRKELAPAAQRQGNRKVAAAAPAK